MTNHGGSGTRFREGCFFKQDHPATRDESFDVQIVTPGCYHSCRKPTTAKEACRMSIGEQTGLFQQCEVWEQLFSKHSGARRCCRLRVPTGRAPGQRAKR